MVFFMNYDLKLVKKKSKEKGTVYCALVVDLGYTYYYLSCDIKSISEILNLTVRDCQSIIDKFNVDEVLKVGSVNISYKV